MSARNLPVGYGIRVYRRNRRKFGAYLKVGSLLLAVLAIIVVACQGPPTAATEQWTPPYLQLHLSAGKAKVQWPNTSEWITLEGETSIAIQETGRIIADETEGVQFSLGDGSTLELSPGAVLEAQNPRTFPRLQVTLRDGSLLFVAQKPSYEFLLPTCSVTFLSIPSEIKVEINGEAVNLAVEEGAITCALEAEKLTLTTCQGTHLVQGEEPEVTKFCVASTEIAPPTPTLSPSPTPWWAEPTATPFPSPSSSPTPTHTLTPTRRRVWPTLTPTPVPPTDTPPPPPPPPPKSKPTNTPPPPPTNTPPPPPPTSTPAPPTNTPPPDTPRPTPTSVRPTPSS
ncbi:MAG: hypothetical protein SXV54_19170 [Chloroflexota bacterium]|nr:hypothetical protein [Chloroflexota bacterium]